MSTESKGKQGGISSLSERKTDRQFPPDKGGKDRQFPSDKGGKDRQFSPLIRGAKTDNSPSDKGGKDRQFPPDKGGKGGYIPYNI